MLSTVITAWNALMIRALAFAGRVLGEEKYAKAAINAYEFIKNNLVNPDGLILRKYRITGLMSLVLDDYAFLIAYALLELYQLTYNIEYLDDAIALVERLTTNFMMKNNGYFYISINAEVSLVELKNAHDGEIPSGNSIMALVLLQLADITVNGEYEEKARKILKLFNNDMNEYAYKVFSNADFIDLFARQA
ncbi:MAG: hypothetical protein MZU91_05660 [Desulfosudis oleivorans]|nr:hypothetical protein [Desulfosudis oleivorans]